MKKRVLTRLVGVFLLLLFPLVKRASDPDINEHFPPDPLTLSPPIVGEPIHECARVVFVSGFIPHAIVRVYAQDQNVKQEVAKANPDFGFADIPLTRELKLNERITATQSVGSVVSLESYDP